MDTVEKDTIDATNTKSSIDRPDAPMPVVRSSEMYNMQLKNNRGMALIIAYSEYEAGGPPARNSANHDVRLCKTAFERLKYDVKVHWNLHRKDFWNLLDGVSKADHSESDSLVIIFMSHGGVNKRTNMEYLETYNGRVDTVDLWKNFTPDKCPSLSGKPKMFFIQACRGEESDKGVQLKNVSGLCVQTDSIPLGSMAIEEQDYAIPLYADMLMMWASYPGTFAFNAFRDGIKGSVFLHFLSKILNDYAEKEDLSSMLLRISREVALKYESYCPDNADRNNSKQVPQTVSTLIRKVYFFERVDLTGI